MKKIILYIAILFSISSFAQVQISDGYAFERYTTAELLARTGKQIGDVFYDETLESHVTWNGTTFDLFGSQGSDVSLAAVNQVIPSATVRSILLPSTSSFIIDYVGNAESILEISNEDFLINLDDISSEFFISGNAGTILRARENGVDIYKQLNLQSNNITGVQNLTTTTLLANTVTSSDLSGTGTRMVVVDSQGTLNDQALPSDGELNNGTNTTVTGDGTVGSPYQVNISDAVISTAVISENPNIDLDTTDDAKLDENNVFTGTNDFQNDVSFQTDATNTNIRIIGKSTPGSGASSGELSFYTVNNDTIMGWVASGKGDFGGFGLADPVKFIGLSAFQEGPGLANSFYIFGSGEVFFDAFAGTGTRMMVADEDGFVSTQAIPSGGGSGDVTAASSFGTDNRLIRSDGTGKGVQSSGITIDDTNNVSGFANVLPDGNGTRDLGSSGFPWLNGYINTLRFSSGLGSSISLTGSLSLDSYLDYAPTDTQPSDLEGRVYWDDSENRLKAYDDTSWKAFILEGDVAGGVSDGVYSGITVSDSGATYELSSIEKDTYDALNQAGKDALENIVIYDADGTANSNLTASDILVVDTQDYYTETNVETIFEEIGETLDNTAIGETVLNSSRNAIDSDRFGIIVNTTASDFIYTIQDGDFSIGDRLFFENFSTGNIEIAYGGAVTGDVAETVNNAGFVQLKKTGTDTWIIEDAEAILTQAEYSALPAGVQSNIRYTFYFTD